MTTTWASRLDATAVAIACVVVFACVTPALPVGRVAVVNDTETTLLDVDLASKCASKHVDRLAPGATASIWFWGCGETGGTVSFADDTGRYDFVGGGYLDPAPSGAITIRILSDAARVERDFLLTSLLTGGAG